MTLPSSQMGKLRPRASKEKGQGLDPDLCSQPCDTCYSDMLKDKDMKPCCHRATLWAPWVPA